MFERFRREARETVVQAQSEARRLHSERIGTQHPLLALLAQDTPTAAVLVRNGLSRDSVTAAVTGSTDARDADALGTPGIDLDVVRERVESASGPAKKVLELSLRETLAMRQKTITDGHIALGVIREGQGLAMRVLADRGIDGERLAGEIKLALLS